MGSAYMEHDWLVVSEGWSTEIHTCKRCSKSRYIEGYNVPCGTSTRTYWRDAYGNATDTMCLAKD